jgi:hypothetical protein
VLLALTIISTGAAVSGALSALGLLPQRRRDQPPTVVIVVTSIEGTVRQAVGGSPQESDPKLESAA